MSLSCCSSGAMEVRLLSAWVSHVLRLIFRSTSAVAPARAQAVSGFTRIPVEPSWPAQNYTCLHCDLVASSLEELRRHQLASCVVLRQGLGKFQWTSLAYMWNAAIDSLLSRNDGLFENDAWQQETTYPLVRPPFGPLS